MDTKLKFIMRLFQLLHILANQWLFNYNLIKIVVEDFVPGHPQTCLSALGSQAHTVLFSSDMGRLWVQSHIGKRSAPLMPYKCLAQAWVYHYCSNDTLMLVPGTYKAWVRHFSCRCGTALKVFPCRLRTKPCRLDSPKWTNKLVAG